jgi:hypothetical protein
MKRKLLTTFVVVATLLVMVPLSTPTPVLAATFQENSFADTYLIEESPDEAVGSDIGMAAGAIPSGARYRSLVTFTVYWGDDIPANSTISTATLRLYYYAYETGTGYYNPSGRAVYADRVIKSWSESTATWNSPWTMPGCSSPSSDYTTSDRASTTVPSSYGWMEWDVTNQVIWAQSQGQNNIRFRISMVTETAGYVPVWAQKEYGSSYKPRITINYNSPAVPTVTTGSATSILNTTATLQAAIINTGGATVTTRGVQYGLTKTPTWNKHETGTFGVGSYAEDITGLTPSTTYWFRGYATSIAGTGYGSWVSFSTVAHPVVVTLNASNIASTSARLNSALISDGGSGAIIRFCWGLNPLGDVIPENATMIYSVTDLQNINNDLTAYYCLANDIDASGYNFTPIGGYFTGILNGNGYIINNLTVSINGSGIQLGALFYGLLGTVENLGIENCFIYAASTDDEADAAGITCFISSFGTIQNCHVTGTITAIGYTYAYAGGIATYNYGIINQSYSVAQIYAQADNYAGGGGLVAMNVGGEGAAGTITQSYATGDVQAIGGDTGWAAGFVYSNSYEIENCYAKGNTSASGANSYASGFIVYNFGDITDCYSIGVPNATTLIGGFCAVNSATATGDFWDIETSGTETSDGGTGENTTEMKTQSTFTDWDFDSIWDISGGVNDGYPYLQHTDLPPGVSEYDFCEILSGTYNTGSYPYLDISDLLPGHVYYFRVYATNVQGTCTGEELTFTTLTSLEAPTNFYGYPTATTISLSWIRGVGSTNTLIRYGITNYPQTTAQGQGVYFGPGNSYTLQGLTSGQTYYFSAWGESGGNYSTGYAMLLMTTSAGTDDTTPDIEVPTQPAWWFSTDYTAMNRLGFIYDSLNSAMDSGQIPRTTGWFWIAIGLAFLAGLLGYLFLGHKLMIAMMCLTVVFALEYFAHQVPWWVPLITLILVIVFSQTHKQTEQG